MRLPIWCWAMVCGGDGMVHRHGTYRVVGSRWWPILCMSNDSMILTIAPSFNQLLFSLHPLFKVGFDYLLQIYTLPN